MKIKRNVRLLHAHFTSFVNFTLSPGRLNKSTSVKLLED